MKKFLKRKVTDIMGNIESILLSGEYEINSNITLSEIKELWKKYPHIRRVYERVPENFNSLRSFPILKNYPSISRSNLPFLLRISSRFSSTTGTTKRKILINSYLDLPHLASLLILAREYNYLSDKGTLFISSGYAPEGVPYGSYSSGKVLELIYPKGIFYHGEKGKVDKIIKKIKRKGVEIDTLLIFSAWLPLVMEKIVPNIPLSKDVNVLWMGDILTKGILSYIFDRLKERGVENIRMANYYGCVEANFIGVAFPVKVKQADEKTLEELTRIRIFGYPSFLTFLEYETTESFEIKTGKEILTHEDLEIGKRYSVLLNAIATVPLLNYYLRDIVEYLGMEKGRVIVRIIGRMPFIYKMFDKNAYAGEYVRIKGYTLRSSDLISVLDSLSSTYLVIFEENPKYVSMVVYSEKSIKIEDIINKISKMGLEWSLWVIRDLYGKGILEYKNITGESARKYYENLSRNLGRKIPKVLVIK